MSKFFRVLTKGCTTPSASIIWQTPRLQQEVMENVNYEAWQVKHT